MPPKTYPTPSRSTRTTKSAAAPVALSTDDLADKLATKLTISNGKAKANLPVELTLEERKAGARRAVNAASKSLSAVLETGWKTGSEAKPTVDGTTATSVTKHAEGAGDSSDVGS
ncbi:uncharacterized protein BXZ73DRAFT_104695 [Epithele typhae]|uniref:uncharacterized protein n=1 Tax=Epithele typhae TaxID=378194 RepID=UPI0020079BCF|nr:uncharacterized protein BXZ73DRAFT_104695 [Epithele typhae]KAH9920568.1 hypothetical protein BXZ73DRAFT_104695 [Epithele typhae]